MPANSGLFLSFSRSSIMGVTSTVRNSVTCGAVYALATMACAVALRTPRMGTRRSRVAGSTAGCAALAAPVAAGGVEVPSAARSTSSRVITSPWAAPGTVRRSTPSSLASLRTGGFANGTNVEAEAGEGGTAGLVMSSTAVRGLTTSTVCTGSGAPVRTAAAFLRGLRLAGAEPFDPYPTSGCMSSSRLPPEVSPPESADARSAPFPDGVGLAVPFGSTSTVRMGEPTSTVWPGSANNSVTTPAHGIGSSTAAFAVSISTTIWLTFTSSPGWTFHSTISASVSPSAVSARRNCLYSGIPSSSPVQSAVDGVEYPVEVRQEMLLRLGRRVRGVESGHPQHRRLQRVEALLLHPGRDLGGDRRLRRGLAHRDQPAGATHRLEHRAQVQRRQCA